jgi:hypothetical protein
MKFQLFSLSIFLIFSTCIQFKVDVLEPDLVTKIQIGQEPTHLQTKVVNNVLTNLPLTIPYQSGLSYLTDIQNSLIKGFDSQGNLDLIIGNLDSPLPSSVDHYKYKFGNIGNVVLDSGDNLYIQNRFGNKEGLDQSKEQENLFKKYSGSFEVSASSPLPSYILKMDKKGNVLSILGASGKNTEPFRFIEYMIAAKEDSLFVYHKLSEEMRLTYYNEENLEGEIRESNLDLFQKDDAKLFQIHLDTMLPHPSGAYALVSLSYYNKADNRFKFRRIFQVNFQDPKKTILLKEIQDPGEILFSVRENNEFYIWETEDKGNSVRFQVHDAEGNHVNNKRLDFTPPRGQWRETFTDAKDNIYSIRIRSGFLELYRWR